MSSVEWPEVVTDFYRAEFDKAGRNLKEAATTVAERYSKPSGKTDPVLFFTLYRGAYSILLDMTKRPQKKPKLRRAGRKSGGPPPATASDIIVEERAPRPRKWVQQELPYPFLPHIERMYVVNHQEMPFHDLSRDDALEIEGRLLEHAAGSLQHAVAFVAMIKVCETVWKSNPKLTVGEALLAAAGAPVSADRPAERTGG